MATKLHAAEETTLGVIKQVTDLGIGDVIQAPGFDGARTIKRATKVSKGPQKGKLELQLVDPDGNVDVADFGPEENVTVVGHEDAKKKAEPTVKVPKGKKGSKTGAKEPAPEAKTEEKPAPAPKFRR